MNTVVLKRTLKEEYRTTLADTQSEDQALALERVVNFIECAPKKSARII